MAVGRAVEQFVEAVAEPRQAGERLGGDADLERVGEIRLQRQRRDQRDEVGVAAALAEAVQRALDLPHAGAHGGERIGDRVVGVVMGVDAELLAGDASAPPRATMRSTSCGSVPPLVSHSTTQRAPAS